MHLRFGALRKLIAAIAIVAFALPLTTPFTGKVVRAQTPVGITGSPVISYLGSAANPYVSVTPSVALNIVGTPHSFVFTCGAQVGNPTQSGLSGLTATGFPPGTLAGGTANIAGGVVPGCYNVTASVSNETNGTATSITSARFGHVVATVNGSTANGASYQSPLCGAGFETTPTSATSCDTPDPTAPEGSQAVITINPGAADSYLVTFTGYTPLRSECAGVTPTTPSNPNGAAVQCTNADPVTGAAVSACPAGFEYVAPGSAGLFLTTSISVPPLEAPLAAPDGVCKFTVQAEKKYVQITNITLTTVCGAAPGPSTLTYSEGLKAYFGVPCVVTPVISGIVYINSNGCGTVATGPNNPIPAAPNNPFPAGSYYTCSNGNTLAVVIPDLSKTLPNGSSLFASYLGTPLTITTTGSAAAYLTTPTPTLGALCAAGAPGSPTTFFGQPIASIGFGSSFVVCPRGPGVGTVQVCFTGPAPDSQPAPICSSALTFSYTLPASTRVVPTVRWAGEKEVLTKCFGGNGAGLGEGLDVEFTLGQGSTSSASLFPVNYDSTFQTGTTTSANSNTVFTLTDENGCASVVVYAAGEGVVNVEASIYAPSGAGTDLLTGDFHTAPVLANEHAFQIFFLRFERLDIENTKPVALTGVPTSFGLATGTVATLPNPPGANPQPAGGYIISNIAQQDLVRAMVHGYFEFPGNPSGRGATTVSIPGAGSLSGAATSYTLPAGRWVLPEDWPVLATFAGISSINLGPAAPGGSPTASANAWDINSGWVFTQSENALLCQSPTGSCASTDAAGTAYASAGTGSPTGSYCNGGATITNSDGSTRTNTAGITVGPFDATQACTSPFPLTYTPRGASILQFTPANTTVVPPTSAFFTDVPLSTDSSYLPNGTLNEWDAPMPPAQITFGITGGPGFLNQVDKSAVYRVGNFYPNQFYQQNIPADPRIPPVTNNGGYLWNTFGLTTGFGPSILTTTTNGFVAGLQDPSGLTAVTTAPAFTNGGVGGLGGFYGCDTLAGEVFLNGTDGATVTPPGYADTLGPGCYVGISNANGTFADLTVTPAECDALGGTLDITLTGGPNGACQLYTGTPPVAPANTSVPGTIPSTVAPGTNYTAFGTNCPAVAGQTSTTTPAQSVNPNTSGNVTVTIADGAGFTAGQTVSVYAFTDGDPAYNTGAVAGDDTGIDATVAAVSVTGTTLTLSGLSAGAYCFQPFTAVIVSDQLGFGVPSTQAATMAAGSTVLLTNDGGFTVYESTVQSVAANTSAGTSTVYVNDAQDAANHLGSCTLTPTTSTTVDLTCLPSAFFPAGSLIAFINGGGPDLQRDPSAYNAPGAQGPYPFWTWVPNPQTSTTSPNAVTGTTTVTRSNQTGTVYSDNHGEAMVSLVTGYGSAVGGLTETTSSAALRSLGFSNVVATAPACTGVNTLTGQPAAGAICTNSLGGIEIGTGATLGTTTIQAVADYPYNRGINQPIASATLTKIFQSAFIKSIVVGAAITGPAGTTTYPVTVTALDISGNPLTGETVNVYALGNAGAVVLAPTSLGGVSNGNAAATVTIGANGTATLSLEVLPNALGTNGLVLKAVFPRESIERFAQVVAGTLPNNTLTVTYGQGYQMISVPAPTVITTAERIFSYGAATNSYTDVTNTAISPPGLSTTAPSCQGYFAYFAAPTTVTLNVPSNLAAGQTASCVLNPGWNLVGNPFGTAAVLPTGTVAYYFDGTSYTTVGTIGVGRAVFVYNGTGVVMNITLTSS